MPILQPQVVNYGAGIEDEYFVRKNVSGDANIVGNLTVDGKLFVDTIEPISTTEPVYIRAPNELGGEMLNNSSLIVEGGANKLDSSQNQVSIATYKPLTRGIIDYGQGEQVGSLSMWGKDTSANDTKYVDLRGVITNPINGQEESRLNFVLHKANANVAYLQIDTSENIVKTLTNTRLQAGGNIIALADISCNGDVYVGDDLFVNDDVNCADVLATASIQANRFVSLGTTVPSALAGTTYRVNGIDAGRVNHDSVNMNITGITGTAGAVQQICGTQVASRATKDISDSITMAFGSSNAPRTILTVQDASSTYFVSHSYSAEVATGGGAALPLDATTSTFVPRYSGSYHFEMTYIFDTSANGGVVNDDNVFGFRVSGAGNDYGACIAGKAITLPASGNALPYTISSIHQLIAGTTYTITYIYLGTAGSKGGTAGGYLLEANLV
jgi:hypothetical protein